MKKRIEKRPAAPRRNPCRAVVPIDGTPIRRKVRRDYEKVRRDLGRCRKDLTRFETQDRPRFEQWMHRNWGALLTQIREVSQQLSAKEQLIREIEMEVFFTGASSARAYQRVTSQKAAPAADRAETSGGPEGGPNESPFTEGSGSERASGHDPWNEMFENMGEAFADMFGATGQARWRQRRPEDQAAGPSAGRLKELYRALVRRLHPDTQSEMTSEKLERWHQAQEAYQKRDVEQLEVLLTLCDIEDRGTTAQTSLSLLTRITRQFASTVRLLKKQLRAYRRDPAWNFGARQEWPILTALTERRLRQELRSYEERLERVENQLQEWAAQASRLPRRRPASRPARSDRQVKFFF